MEDEKRFCSDRISNLPPSIIETILCRVPTKEAVRTSILSTEWKYHWTKIPKFEFIQNHKQQGEETTQAKRKLFSVINQVMSSHECPIEEFSLSTDVRGACVEVDHIIDNFSRNNNLKKLQLHTCGYWVPESFFSLHKLTDLFLGRCRLDVVQPTRFTGFGSLTNLYTNGLRTTKRMLQLFLSGCPLLNTVTLIPNFRRLPDNDDSTLAQLFECLPVIENLTVRLSIMKFYDQGRLPKLHPATALVHLKHLCILDDESYRYRLHSLVYLVRSCPNIEKLTLKISYHLYIPDEDVIKGDSFFSNIWLGHLEEVEIYFFREGISFHSFILILEKSPMLKKVKILLSYKASKKEMLMIKGAFLAYPRVSRVVKFVIESKVKKRNEASEKRTEA